MNPIPFTYLIGWSAHAKFYYGVRYARHCNPSELWKTYFTSSKYVKAFRLKYGEPDVVEIRRVFSDGVDARNWEHRVLKRMRVESNDSFLNKSSIMARCSNGQRNGMYRKNHSIESRQKMRDGWALRDDHKNMSRAGDAHPMWGKAQKQNVIDALRAANLGAIKTAETREKIGASKRGRTWWNDGASSKMAVICPGENWVRGRYSPR